MIGVIEYKHDKDARAVPVAVGNVTVNGRYTTVHIASPAAKSSKLELAVAFTKSGMMSTGDVNYNCFNSGYLRQVYNLLAGARSSWSMDTTRFSLRTFVTVSAFHKYMTIDCVLPWRATAPSIARTITPPKPSITLADTDEYTIGKLMNMATELVGTNDSIYNVGVRVGPQPVISDRLSFEELQSAASLILNALPAATAQLKFNEKLSELNTQVNSFFSYIGTPNTQKLKYKVVVATE